MASHQRINSKTAALPVSSSRSPLPPASTASNISSTSNADAPETSAKTFNRLRSSLEQSLRHATRSKTKPLPVPADDFGTVVNTKSKGKEKEKPKAKEEAPPKEKDKSRMLRRLESKVGFRRSVTPTPPPVADKPKEAKKPNGSADKVRAAGFTSFITPSLRQASMSSPALHLSSQAIPSPKSQSAVPASSSSTSSALVSPTRDRSGRASVQPSTRGISGPIALTSSKRDSGSRDPSREHKPRKQRPTPLTSPSTPSLPSTNRGHTPSPMPETPTRRTREPPSPPVTPTPNSRGQHVYTSRRMGASSSNHLPLDSRASSPSTPRASSPVRARSPTNRTRPANLGQRAQASSSSSHLPLSPSPGPRRPSIDAPRRSVDSKRGVSPATPVRRATSPAQLRDRAQSPGYAQNRHFNISTTSLSGPSNPEHRELVRTATSLLCKELVKPPPQLGKSDAGAREWEEVEVRMRALMRLERIWGKSGGTAGGSSSQLTNIGATSSSGLSAGGEERERRLFGEAVRDGYVLCQVLNKLRPGSIARPNPREDGFVHTSNVTKFLAACTSYGMTSDNLFHRDDLIEATPESLARVARTIIALVKLPDAPLTDRSKILFGQGRKPGASSGSSGGASPYGQTSSSRAAASTPNLSIAQPQQPLSQSPVPPSPSNRKRWSPPAPGLPTVRADSAENSSDSSDDFQTAQTGRNGLNLNVGTFSSEMDDVPPMKPPPRSPLRPRAPSKPTEDNSLFTIFKGTITATPADRIDSSGASVGESTRDSVAESAARQSMASSNVTETTAFSLLDVRQTSRDSNTKYGTIRTVTTEATSMDSPSFTRTEGSSIAASLADEQGRKRGAEGGVKFRERRPSETAVVDLSRVAEEGEEFGSSSKDLNAKGKGNAAKADDLEQERMDKRTKIRLGQAKWPDDFFDVLPPPSPTRPIPIKSPGKDKDASSNGVSVSISPPRKLAIVGRRNESVESLPQFPRRPTHRARHSVDTPGLAPKESILRRDASPDGLPSNRLMLRRSSSKGPRPNGVYIPRSDDARASRDDVDAPVPFPRTVSGEHATPSPTHGSSSEDRQGDASNVPRGPRGRFQSEIEGSSARRRARPNSYDEYGNKPRRTRFESMVNLGVGVGAGNASASDLMSRDSLDGSAVRQTLIVREEGKPPTNFQLGNCIGRGQFGSVYRALNLNTGQMVAVKRIRLEGLKEEEVTQLMREVDLVKSLSHPSIVKYEGMARDENTLSIVLEYVENGSLGQTLKAFGKLNERLVASYVVKILEGLHYLHQSDVVHCDLKAANILTTKHGNVKLSDFGVSLNLRAMEREIKDVAGTPNWMAPEVIELKGASTKSDIWSLACTIIELLTGRPPYGEIANSMTVMFRIVEDDMPPIPEGCSELLQNFLKLCFDKDPTQRPNAETLFEHQWLKTNWGHHKELRPQDSIPFLRRVSADLQKSDAVRFLSQIDMPESSSPDQLPRLDDFVSGSPGKVARRVSNGPSSPRGIPDSDAISPREHSFVKTTFSKSMTCRVCLLSVKKSAVLCEQCSLIAHSKCAHNAPPTCDLRAQLLMYAQYAEKGNQGSPYGNPMDFLTSQQNIPTSPTSDTSFVITPRASLDGAPPPPTPAPAGVVHPPTAYKFMAAFKRSRTSTSPERSQVSSTSQSQEPAKDTNKINKKKSKSVLRKTGGRPHSLSSNASTAQNTSSMRSAATSREDGGRVSALSTNRDSHGRFSGADSEAPPSSAFSGASSAHDDDEGSVPGGMPTDTRRHKRRERDSKSSEKCNIQ
ncbi:hypothetical protein PLICRDRAFT_177128 [Plicaturopsis crispa FD-325 SS-3]|nr:hypothetical protein PLICRDRAFT_177128 [Plicaturopsis crispa FD-325 SS-3]